ncbi:MAG: hypothetical protein ABW174_08390 [Flavitalea sp.]
MEPKRSIPNLVESTINSLDGLTRASPGPFFYTRVMARMDAEEKNLWEKATAFITRPIVIAVVICFVLLLNVTAMFQQNELSSEVASEQADGTIVDQYKIASTSFYDYTNAEP